MNASCASCSSLRNRLSMFETSTELLLAENNHKLSCRRQCIVYIKSLIAFVRYKPETAYLEFRTSLYSTDKLVSELLSLVACTVEGVPFSKLQVSSEVVLKKISLLTCCKYTLHFASQTILILVSIYFLLD